MLKKNSYTFYHFSLLLFLLVALYAIPSCTKPEKEYAVIKGTVKHHEWEVSGMKVYIKKNAKDFPGFNEQIYEDSTVAKSSIRFKAPFVFRNIEPGDYYLMAKGFDTTFNMPAKGAIYVNIQDGYDIKDISLIVSE